MMQNLDWEGITRGFMIDYHSLSLRNCSFIKTILMLFVILGHSTAFWSGHWFNAINVEIQSSGLRLIYEWVSSFHIYGFTLVSGYIFAYKSLKGGYSTYRQFIKIKMTRLLVPYLFVMLIWVVPISEYYFRWNFSSLLKRYLLCISPSQLWFLWMLFWVFVIVWPLRNLFIRKPLSGWIIALAFWGAGTIGDGVLPNFFCIWTACSYIIFFYIGMRLRVKEENDEKLITELIPWYIWIIIDVVFFSSVNIVNTGLFGGLYNEAMTIILHIVGAIMAWTVLQKLACIISFEDSAVFNLLSRYSMPMYLFHQQIIYFTVVWLNGKVSPWINAGVNFIVAITGSFLISTLLMRWKVTRFLVGEK